MPSPSIAIHARRFEGQCHDRAKTGTLLCHNPEAMRGVGLPALATSCHLNKTYFALNNEIIPKHAVMLTDRGFWTHRRRAKGKWPQGATDGSLLWHPNGTSDKMYLKQNPGCESAR